MLLIALALVSGVWFWRRYRAEGTRSGSAAAVDSLDLLSPQQLFVRQSELFQQRRPSESMIYARRLSERLPRNWQVRLNYATTLNAAAMEQRPGGAITRTRSSFERVAMLRKALAELDVADRCARSAQDHGAIQVLRGDLYRIWGFAADALEAYRSGVQFDPGSAKARKRVEVWTRAVLYPGSMLEPF